MSAVRVQPEKHEIVKRRLSHEITSVAAEADAPSSIACVWGNTGSKLSDQSMAVLIGYLQLQFFFFFFFLKGLYSQSYFIFNLGLENCL